MKTFENSKGEKVTLTGKEAMNSFGFKYIWVKCENGAVVSIRESEFNRDFWEV